MSPKEKYSNQVAIPSVDSSLWLAFIPFLLSVIAGSSDTISFLGLDGLFTAHITGNLVILAAHIVAGSQVSIAGIISVPVFFAMLVLTKVSVNFLERRGIITLHILLFFHFFLLACCFLFGIFTMWQNQGPNTAIAVLAGMLGVCAMALQNALNLTSLQGSPTTAVMTTNITRFTLDIGEVLLGTNPERLSRARTRAINTWPAIVGFALGCGLGAALQAAVNLWALILPSIIALITFIMGLLGRYKMH